MIPAPPANLALTSLFVLRFAPFPHLKSPSFAAFQQGKAGIDGFWDGGEGAKLNAGAGCG